MAHHFIRTVSILFMLGLPALPNFVSAQNSDFEKIKNSAEYLWGYGESEDYDLANKRALEDLLSKISVHVESEFEYVAEEAGGDFKEYTKSVINTYSNATLTDTREKVFEKKGVYHILRYIKNSDLQKLFAHRGKKIRDYLYLGTKAQRENRAGDALRYYYWSYALYLSHPYRSELKAEADNRDVLIGLLLHDRINALLSKIKFSVDGQYKYENEDKTKVVLSCTVDGEPVNSLDFRYSLAGNVSPPNEVSNGKTELLLIGVEQGAFERLNIRIEYKYENKSYQDQELYAVLKAVNVPFFKKSAKSVPLTVTPRQVKAKKIITPEFESLNKLDESKNFYRKTVKKLLIAITEKDYDKASAYFSPEGKEMFHKLIQYGQVSVLPLSDTLKIIRLQGETLVRSVPMAFYFPNSNRQFMESVVFTFNDEGLIDAVSFALSDHTIFDILSHTDNFGTVSDKYTLIKFMEFYKTAYSLKRLEYIKSVFSENALIIVGTVLKPTVSIEGRYKSLGTEAIRYQRFSKKEYIERLERVFNSKEYINIDFDEAIVRKVNGDQKIYGIQIAQQYYSSNYNDFGYLFLMIDLNDSLNPTIYVRTWQPEKNADGSIYGLEDFRMN